MAERRRDGFFPGEAELAGREGRWSVYRVEFPDGWGTMTSCLVMPGIWLIRNDFHTASGFPEEERCPGLVEINHCRAGRFECTMLDGRLVWLGPQDFSVSDMSRPPLDSRFRQGLYQGISLVLEPGTAGASLGGMLGEEAPDLPELFRVLLSERHFLVLRSEPRIQHIFSELYHVPAEGEGAYYKLKTAELMLFLQERQRQVRRAGAVYHSRDLTRRVRELEARMTEDLRAHIPIPALAEEYRIGQSTLKKYFLRLYGEPPYAYLKRRRMEEAAFLLDTTGQSVTQIAAAVGYQNASKFSAAFRSIYGLSPQDYKKGRRLE